MQEEDYTFVTLDSDDALLLDNSHMTISQQKEWLAEQFEKVCKS